MRISAWSSDVCSSDLVLHRNRTYLLRDPDGQILDADSISAGLDYPGIGPEHAWLKEMGRVEYVTATDREALDAFRLCSRLEGIIQVGRASCRERVCQYV